MRKKLLNGIVTLTVLLVCICLLPTKAQAASESDLTFELNDDGESYRVTDCNTSASGELIIPATYNGKPVTSIGDFAFSYCSGLTSITIPNDITSIGAYAFEDCSKLTSITIPDSVTGIGKWAFYYCSSLSSVTIPDGVTSIDQGVFSYCTSLTSITLPDSVTSIGDRAFDYCSSLTSITIPDGVTSIGDGVFSYCKSLTSVTIPDSVNNIGDCAFDYCYNLSSITIPDSVTSIGDNAFLNCSSLTSIAIPDSVTSIGDYTFDYCSSLTGIWVDENNPVFSNDSSGVLFNKDKTTLIAAPGGFFGSYIIPDSVIVINSHAFCECSKLTSITLPDSVTSIGNSAFFYCSELTSITIPDGVTSIGNRAFSGCSSLTSVTISNGVTSIGDSAFSGCSSLTSITIPDSVTSISEGMFWYCSSLTSITIPDSVTSIGDDAFYYCSKLTSITIPDSVTSIGDEAFRYCSSLTSVAIPDSVTRIGGSTFSWCTSLTSVTIGNGITSIEDYAFHYCSSLTSIIIPDSVTSISGSAFSGCSNLATVYYGGTEVERQNISIGSGNSSLTSATWHYEVVDTVCGGQECYYCPACNDCFTPDGSYAMATVVFKDWDGTVLSTKSYRYGDVVAVPTDPTKAADNTYTYTFDGWDKEVVACAGDAVYTAIYKATYIDYTVKFLNENGATISEKTYHWGDKLEIPADPTKAADNIYFYFFAGWDKEVVACAGDAVYTATYIPIYIIYTVRFLDDDGETISEMIYNWGDKVQIPADPTKAADNTYTYVFAGWDKEIVDCVGDATYTATYKATYIDYTVTFQYEDGTVIAQYTSHYGYAVVVPEDPAAPEVPGIKYAFDGWDAEVTACTGNAVYTAVFRIVYPVGDFTKDNEVTSEDVMYLLWHTLFPETYPVDAQADFTGDGQVTNEDVICLLWHALFPEEYPLIEKKKILT